MADTIRERIIQAVATRAGAILVSGGYKTDCGLHVFRVRKALDPAEDLDAVVIWPDPEESTRSYGIDTHVMPVRLQGIALFGEVNPSVISERILGDLIKAMTVSDPTGGLAEDIEYATGGSDDYPDEGEITVGCEATFKIKYKTLKGDPYTQPG